MKPIILPKLLVNAKKGEAKAQYLLGLMYYEGWETGKDIQMALKWFKQAAEKGEVKAQYLLGLIYYQGKEVKQDIETAYNWLFLAAEQGLFEAQYLLTQLIFLYENKVFQPSREEQYKQLPLADLMRFAEIGKAKAQYLLGLKYYEGKQIKKNLHLALCWLLQAMDKGVTEAQEPIKKIKKEYEQLYLTELFTRAEQGNEQAQYSLGLRYYKGQTVQKNLKMALKWLERAAKQGSIDAQKLLIQIHNENEVYPDMFDAAIENALRIERETFPLKSNIIAEYHNKEEQDRHYEHLFKHGILLYQSGKFDKAIECFLNLAKQGYSKAQFKLALMYMNGEGVPKDSEQSNYWFSTISYIT